MRSPWGAVQTADALPLGAWSVTTASHGGMYVPKALLARVPIEAQEYAQRWSGCTQWFEEDCAATLLVVAIPELLRTVAERTLVRELAAKMADTLRLDSDFGRAYVACCRVADASVGFAR